MQDIARAGLLNFGFLILPLLRQRDCVPEHSAAACVGGDPEVPQHVERQRQAEDEAGQAGDGQGSRVVHQELTHRMFVVLHHRGRTVGVPTVVFRFHPECSLSSSIYCSVILEGPFLHRTRAYVDDCNCGFGIAHGACVSR